MEETLLGIALIALFIFIVWFGAAIRKRRQDYEERLNALRVDKRVAFTDDLLKERQRRRSLNVDNVLAVIAVAILITLMMKC